VGERPIRGSCLCGAIRFELWGPPLWLTWCHCSRCRKVGGMANLTVRAEHFRWVQGEPLVQRHRAEPPFHLVRCFCRACGTYLGEPQSHPKLFPIAASALDDDPGVRPILHEHVAGKAPWYEILDDLPQFPADPPLSAFGGGAAPAAPEPGAEVSLREITAETLDAVLGLSVKPEQRPYVASNAKSIAQAHFHPEAWPRAIHAGDTAVGLLMLHDENLRPEPRRPDLYFLWRLMIGAPFQRRGYARRALELLVEHVRSRPHARQLFTSCRPGPASPEPFYLAFGFRRTGVVQDDGEVELVLPL
jgi:diamine N-acetyltransferase